LFATLINFFCFDHSQRPNFSIQRMAATLARNAAQILA
jgi:hypothetical protein